MTDDFEDAFKRWLHQRAGDDRAAIQALAGNVAVLPPRRVRQNRLVPLAASVAVLLGALWLLSPRSGGITDEAASTPTSAPATSPSPARKPTGPEAFAGDPRLARCFGTADDMEFVFVMSRARDYQLFLPNMGTSPELDVDDSALVVVYREGWAGPQITGVPGALPESPTPGRRFVCVVPGTGDPVLYGDVDIEGLSLAVEPSFTPPSPTPRPPSPGDPYAWLDDPRLHTCYPSGRPNQMEWVFEITSANDYGLFARNPGLADDLEARGAALVVVYRADVPYPPGFGPGAQTRQTAAPGYRVVCMVYDDGVWSQTGLEITTLDVDALPTGPTDQPPESAGPTPSPAPAWTAGAEAALGCDGQPSSFGSDWSQGSFLTAEQPTPGAALADFVQQVKNFYLPFPTSGYSELGQTGDGAAYAYSHRGSSRAVVRLHKRDAGAGDLWYVDDIAGCDPSEWGPDAELPLTVTIWTDAAGRPVPTTAVEMIDDCYNATKLTVAGRLYVWDPLLDQGNYDLGQLDATFSATDPLPEDAVDTGYRSGSLGLYIAADGSAAYVVGADHVERWPHVKGDDYQRIDCN